MVNDLKNMVAKIHCDSTLILETIEPAVPYDRTIYTVYNISVIKVHLFS